ASAQASPQHGPAQPAPARESTADEIERLLAEEQGITRRWLDYELDPAKLIDYPVMTDIREQVTVDFHRARHEVDLQRQEDPVHPNELHEDERLVRYRDAVREYTINFQIAEREAKRRRAADFTPQERQCLDRAKQLLSLADDSAATQAERQSAYK